MRTTVYQVVLFSFYREAGGSFSKREKAVEDQYFRRLVYNHTQC